MATSTKRPVHARTTGVTGMLVIDDRAVNHTIYNTNKGFRVQNNETLLYDLDYDPTFARWINQRAFVRMFKKANLPVPSLISVELTPGTMSQLKQVGFELFDHETFIKKMDPPRAAAIIKDIGDWAAARDAAAAA